MPPRWNDSIRVNFASEMPQVKTPVPQVKIPPRTSPASSVAPQRVFVWVRRNAVTAPYHLGSLQGTLALVEPLVWALNTAMSLNGLGARFGCQCSNSAQGRYTKMPFMSKGDT